MVMPTEEPPVTGLTIEGCGRRVNNRRASSSKSSAPRLGYLTTTPCGTLTPNFCTASLVRCLLNTSLETAAEEPVYGTASASSTWWSEPSSPYSPCIMFTATSTPLSARAGVASTPCMCQAPWRSIKMSRGSYRSRSSAVKTLAPLLSDTSYSLEGPPRSTPTTVLMLIVYPALDDLASCGS